MKMENNLDTDQIRSLVWRLAFPSMLAQFVSVFYSIVDRMYIGNIPEIGDMALAGVGICGPIVTMISSVASWVGIGGAPLLSIRLGQKNEKKAREILANCFLLLVVMSLAITALAFLTKDRLLVWFGASEAIFPYADEYITVYLLGTVFALLTTGMNQFIICQGFAKVGMKSVLLGAVCNIVLDPVFIFVLDMGVAGAAIATVISQAVSCIYVLSFLFGSRPMIRITFGGYRWDIMARVLLVGLTPFLIIALDNIMIISLNATIQKYGGPERHAFNLQHDPPELYADCDNASFRHYRGNPDDPGIQLRGQKAGADYQSPEEYPAAVSGIYRHHVSDCPDYSAVFYYDLYERPRIYLHDLPCDPHLFPDDRSPGGPVHCGGRVYWNGNREGGDQPFRIPKDYIFWRDFPDTGVV